MKNEIQWKVQKQYILLLAPADLMLSSKERNTPSLKPHNEHVLLFYSIDAGMLYW